MPNRPLSEEHRRKLAERTRNYWAQMTPEERKAKAFGGKQGARKPRNSDEAAAAPPPEPPKVPKVRKGKQDSIAAIGNLVWLGVSFPVGLFSEDGARVMQAQIPKAGDHIDRLLQDTRIHELLTGGDSEKGTAALLLFGPPLVGVVGGIIHKMREVNPDNPRLAMFEMMLASLVHQLLQYQGIASPAPKVRAPAPRPAPARTPEPAGPDVPPPVRPAPAVDNGWAPNDAAEVAAAAASRPPSSINE